MYWTMEPSFPVVDRFVVLPGNVFVGLQFTVADQHAPTATAVADLWNRLVDRFSTAHLATVAEWHIIYVRLEAPHAMVVQNVKTTGKSAINSATTAPYRPRVDENGQAFGSRVADENAFCERFWKRFVQWEAIPPGHS